MCGGDRRLHHHPNAPAFRLNSGAGPPRPRKFTPSTADPTPIASSRLGAAHAGEKAVGRLQRCSHRPGRQVGLGDEPLLPRSWPRAASVPRLIRSISLFDETGKEIRSFGAGMFVWPHGIHIDRDGNVWVTDARIPTARRTHPSFPVKTRRAALSSSLVPMARC